jgi:hypothetical protein
MHGLRGMSIYGLETRKSLLLVLFGKRVGSRGSRCRWEYGAIPALFGTHRLVHGCTLAACIADLNAVAVRVVLCLISEVNCTSGGGCRAV